MLIRTFLLAALSVIASPAALAHPHQWVDVASEILFDQQGAIAAIRHHWRFDEAFTAFATQGLDTDGDGRLSVEELEPLARENVESLQDFEFFTFLSAGDYQAGFGAPTDYRLDLDENRLTLHFTLPLAQPLSSKAQILLQVYDPTYYIAMLLPSREAVRLVDAPAGCRLAVFPAVGPDAAAAEALAAIGPEQRELPSEMQGLTGGIDNSAEINCGGPVVAAGEPAAAETAGEAVELIATGGGQETGLDRLAAGAAPQASASAAAEAEPAAGGFMARLAALQAGFNRDLTAALSGLKADGSVFWWLAGVSFLYGIVHAAGPGHGKVVISSYLVANEARLRRGVLIAFLSALVQALVAIGIVGVMAALLNMTSMAMTDAASLLEAGSFALVAALGLYLLVTKGRRAWAMLRGGGAHGHHLPAAATIAVNVPQRVALDPRVALRAPEDGNRGMLKGPRHSRAERSGDPRIQGLTLQQRFANAAAPQGKPACSCGHHHHADPAALERSGFGGAAAAVFSVGIRPCTGALVVLVFALAQGIFWAGIASTFLMALGTAITVAALAALAVGAKDLARRLAAGDGRRSGQIMLGLELTAALLITCLGTALFVGSLAA